MKRRLIIAGLAVLAVIVSAGAGSKPEHRYSFRVKPSATSVQLEWVKGCAWQRLSRNARRRLANSWWMILASDSVTPNTALQRSRVRHSATLYSRGDHERIRAGCHPRAN